MRGLRWLKCDFGPLPNPVPAVDQKNKTFIAISTFARVHETEELWQYLWPRCFYCPRIDWFNSSVSLSPVSYRCVVMFCSSRPASLYFSLFAPWLTDIKQFSAAGIEMDVAAPYIRSPGPLIAWIENLIFVFGVIKYPVCLTLQEYPALGYHALHFVLIKVFV